MFVRAFTILFFVVALAGVATAVQTDIEARNGVSSQCDTGPVQCCNSVQDSSSTFISALFGFLDLPLPASGTQVGITCSPINIGGLGSGSSCTQQPVCCNGNTFNGAIVTGCSPVTINA